MSDAGLGTWCQSSPTRESHIEDRPLPEHLRAREWLSWYNFPIQKVHKHVWGPWRTWDDQATRTLTVVGCGMDIQYISSALYVFNRFGLVDFNMVGFNFW